MNAQATPFVAKTLSDAAQPREWGDRWVRTLVLLAGLLVTQFVVIGPSLVGVRILLPLELLPAWGAGNESAANPDTPCLSDLVTCHGMRLFIAREYRQGRVPLWNPQSFAGTPFATFPKYSLFMLPFYLSADPIMLAYAVLFKSLTAGVGIYWFFRRVLGVGFWPATIGAWCYPLTGFFIFWQGFDLTGSVACLPFMLIAADETARRPGGWGGIGLAACTAVMLLSGQLDVGCQVLLVSGLFFVYRVIEVGPRPRLSLRGGAPLIAAAGGWALGFALAAPYIAPLLEYTRTSIRIEQRRRGVEERPPVGLTSLTELISPYSNGAYRGGWRRIVGGNELEGASASYAGLLAALVAAPLAWAWRGRFWSNVFWSLMLVLGLSWQLNLPGIVWFLRLPVLKLLSHNRLVFASGFAIVTLSVTGLEVLRSSGIPWGRWCYIGCCVLALTGVMFLYNAWIPPAALRKELGAELKQIDQEVAKTNNPGSRLGILRERARVVDEGLVVYTRFRLVYLSAALFSAIGAIAWAALARARQPVRGLGTTTAGLLVVELLCFAFGVNPQCDPKYYFPNLPVIDELHALPPGRVMSVRCLPVNLNMVYGWDEVCGYDAVDPRQIVEVLGLARKDQSGAASYARTQFFEPSFQDAAGKFKIPAVLSMLGVRYFLFWSRYDPPPVNPLLKAGELWVVENVEAVPRAFVPRTVVAVPPDAPTLRKLADPKFDPRLTAFTQDPLALPSVCSGEARVVSETPTRVVVSADMETAGLVVLADRYDEGWRATINGTPVPVLRTNHVLRGVEAPSGHSEIEFRYEPESVAVGLRIFGVAAFLAALWTAALIRLAKKSRPRPTT